MRYSWLHFQSSDGLWDFGSGYRVQVRERLEHVSTLCQDFSSKETLAHNKEVNHCILQKKGPVWLIRRTAISTASAGKVKHSWHDIHLSCTRSLEKTVDGVVVVGSVWCCLEKCVLFMLQPQGSCVMLGSEIRILYFPYPVYAWCKLWSLLCKSEERNQQPCSKQLKFHKTSRPLPNQDYQMKHPALLDISDVISHCFSSPSPWEVTIPHHVSRFVVCIN